GRDLARASELPIEILPGCGPALRLHDNLIRHKPQLLPPRFLHCNLRICLSDFGREGTTSAVPIRSGAEELSQGSALFANPWNPAQVINAPRRGRGEIPAGLRLIVPLLLRGFALLTPG